MKLFSLNLNHRTNPKTIPLDLIKAIEHLTPDVVCLNEYVDSDKTQEFKESLKNFGYKYISISNKAIEKSNQVLIATKIKHRIGDIKGPIISPHSISNFLHVILENGVEVIGIRIPAFKKVVDLKGYWEELEPTIISAIKRDLIMIGDFNCNPATNSNHSARVINNIKLDGVKTKEPLGDWSFISNDQKKWSKIDHVLVMGKIEILEAEYLSEAESIEIAGSVSSISDHAALIVKI